MTGTDPNLCSSAHADERRTLADQCIGESDETAEIIAQLATTPINFDLPRADAARHLAGIEHSTVHDAY